MANNGRLQILRGGDNFDPSSSTETLLDGQLFYSKKNKKLYIGEDKKPINELKGTQIGLNIENGEGQYSLQTNDAKNNHIKGKGSAGFGRYLGDEVPDGKTDAYNLLSGYVVYCKGEGNSLHGREIGSLGNPAIGNYNLAGGFGLTINGNNNIIGGSTNKIKGSFNIIGGNNNSCEVTDGLIGGHHNTINTSENIQIFGNNNVVEKGCINVSLIGEGLIAKEGTTNVRFLGANNDPNTYFLNPLIVFGAGYDFNSRSNAFEIQRGTGKAYFNNSVEVAVQGDSDNSVVIKKTLGKGYSVDGDIKDYALTLPVYTIRPIITGENTTNIPENLRYSMGWIFRRYNETWIELSEYNSNKIYRCSYFEGVWTDWQLVNPYTEADNLTSRLASAEEKVNSIEHSQSFFDSFTRIIQHNGSFGFALSITNPSVDSTIQRPESSNPVETAFIKVLYDYGTTLTITRSTGSIVGSTVDLETYTGTKYTATVIDTDNNNTGIVTLFIPFVK